MTITLPLDTILPPQYRFLRAKTWGSAWEVLRAPGKGGYFLEEVWRSALPEPGQMVFRYDMGLIDGLVYGIDQSQSPPADSDQISLAGQLIQLQMAPGSDDPANSASWQTVWVGGVDHMEDSASPGSDILLGSRKFYCLDLFAFYAKRWPIDRVGVYANSNFFVNVYNSQYTYNGFTFDGRLLGNRDGSGSLWSGAGVTLPSTNDPTITNQSAFNAKLLCFTYAGAGSTPSVWNDLQVVETTLAAARPFGCPWFYLSGATDLLSNSSWVWPVRAGMTAWDLVTKILDRRRGRGTAMLDWTQNDSSGNITPFLTVNAQQSANITWTDPTSGTTNTIQGATSRGTTVAVDLVGDHRNVSPTFALGDRQQHVYDYVETLGEQIEVLATLDSDSGSLAKRWSASEETAFNTETNATKRVIDRYDPVYQLFGLRQDWIGLVGGNAVAHSHTRADYRCDDTGAIVDPATNQDTDPTGVKVMHDIPLYVGYSYSGSTPARYDGTSEILSPERRPPFVLIQPDTTKDFFNRGDEVYQLTVRVTDYGITLEYSGDKAYGTRFFSAGGSPNSWGGAFTISNISLTVALQLPHRVRMASYGVDPNSPSGALKTSKTRRQTVLIPGLHLWLANANAIWSLNNANLSGVNLGPLRGACQVGSGNYGILRDDRSRLAAYHALASSWYLAARRTATWQLKACGFLPSFSSVGSDGSTSTINYPKIGQCVSTLTAGGIAYTINTPITKVHYNHLTMVTTWLTDWSDLDLR